MTNSSSEADSDATEGISDDQLPEDLQPSDDNPLAKPLEPGETPDVGLNEPSGSFARQQEAEGEESAGADPGGQDATGASDQS